MESNRQDSFNKLFDQISRDVPVAYFPEGTEHFDDYVEVVTEAVNCHTTT